ncbi:extracellular solute-binding protein [Pigmentiphaga soli]|uniref:Extracellular solute-binding protein n=1 Tax=Pigmentiphaga soli TaxID=1007095 RepID=A0ABP8HAL0_9BURK
MNRMLTRIGLALALLGQPFCAGLAAAQDAAPAQVAAIATYHGADRQQRLLEGAKKEGSLTIYGSTTATDQQLLNEAFQKKYGLKINYWRASSEAILQRTLKEAQAGHHEADLLDLNAMQMEAVRREKLLQPVESPLHAELMKGAVAPGKEWAGQTLDMLVQAYNTTKVRKEDLPKAWDDLLDPKWKGQLGIEATDENWFATLLEALGRDKGMKLFGQIADTNGISVRKGHTLLANLVASGEVPLALTIYDYSPAELKQKGAPIEQFVIAPAIGAFKPIALLKTAPHPHAALLYYDFLLGPQAQQILKDRTRVPTNTKIDSPWKDAQVRFIDPTEAVDLADQWTRDFETAVTKRRAR